METFSKNNWFKFLIIVAVALILIGVGACAGYLYYGYKYKIQLEEGKNYEATQSLNAIEYGNATKDVEIVCNFGNKKTIAEQDSGLIFAQNNFDSNGNFIDYSKNSAIQDICGITEAEVSILIGETTQDRIPPKLFNVVLNTK